MNMLKNRIIPFLLFDKNGDCVKTTQFQNRNYIGDILNNIRIFNEKNVDELAIFDLDAANINSRINYNLLEKIASISRMPLTYGGGIKDIDSMNQIIKLGIEKVCINTSSLADKDIISKAAQKIGSQSISVCINYKKIGNTYFIVENNGIIVDQKIEDYLDQIQKNGVGEIILNSFNDDGKMQGYDLNFVKSISQFISRPFINVGGCSNLNDIRKLFEASPNVAAGCSSLFVYKGIYKAVLISYPSDTQKEELYHNQN
ncbi:HisA/HisF-related TIM barrel protein [Candidatus Pelagibacter sp.]|nr:HisA/HisF-related TIM barrel protein [Candidatus Pelagibacter sp.]